jgi:hypothetical protein
MAINKVWLRVCITWAMLGVTILFILDHSFVGPIVWLVVGCLIGYFGPFFLHRFIEVIPHRGEVPPADLFFITPLLGLIHGTLFGALLGMGFAYEYEEQAWQGALLGALLFPPALSSAALVVFSLFPVRTSRPASAEEETFGLTRLHRFFIVLMCLVLPAVALAALVRCLVWILRRPKRLHVYARVQELGGVFGADPDTNKFYGVRWEGPAVGDADVEQLRAFPEMDHLALSGTRVTDGGLARLRRLRRLKGVELAHTAITDAGLVYLAGMAGLVFLDVSETGVGDAGLEHLQGLGKLKYLHLRGTRVTQTGVERLLVKLPGLEVNR